MQKRKIIFPAVCLLCVLVFVCGCGGDESATAPANAPSTEKAGATVNAVNPAAQANQAMAIIDEAQKNAAYSAIAEVKSRANAVYSNNLLQNVSPNDCAAVFSAVNSGTGNVGDFSVKLTSNCPSGFTIAVVAIKGRSLGSPLTDTWSFPAK
jgi:hypothetical protein